MLKDDPSLLTGDRGLLHATRRAALGVDTSKVAHDEIDLGRVLLVGTRDLQDVHLAPVTAQPQTLLLVAEVAVVLKTFTIDLDLERAL